MNQLTLNTSNVFSTSLTAQTIACLEFFERWETPLDQEAHRFFLRVRHEALDFATFQHLAPANSAERALFERFLSSFEEAGYLIRAGQMRADLFFDSWYGLPQAGNREVPHRFSEQGEKV